jgi:hypothetical protein
MEEVQQCCVGPRPTPAARSLEHLHGGGPEDVDEAAMPTAWRMAMRSLSSGAVLVGGELWATEGLGAAAALLVRAAGLLVGARDCGLARSDCFHGCCGERKTERMREWTRSWWTPQWARVDARRRRIRTIIPRGFPSVFLKRKRGI